MTGRSTDWLLAIAGGALLALMIHFNSLLARHTTPVVASWVAHGLGAAAALLLVAVYSRRATPALTGARSADRPPWWFYLGGVPGTFTVILAAITVNSRLSLAGTIAFMLVGQVLFGIVSDHFGLFRTPKRRIALADFGVALMVLTGSALIIFDRV
ncbi:DMT family transporter [Myxococcus sp. K38C18041901]|uniref:DMT family transporter n=1 Tax=Myxococcus guangdongensis TaxID=2906760 RepID=UPI0020A81F1E|nr:DMT family transporter [Myxococcus guangdongensis]MCP3061444.1 DMT family transporter [Myxococcus guangdongensis]